MEDIKKLEELNRKVRGRLYRAAVKWGKKYGLLRDFRENGII